MGEATAAAEPTKRAEVARAGRGSRRSRNRLGEGGRLREEIVAAAERLMAAGSAEDSLSLRAVAREAGIAAPSVYLHFASKEDLQRGIVDAFFVDLRDTITRAFSGIADPREALLAGCTAYCRFAEERPGAYRALFATPRDGAAAPPGEPDPGREALGTLVDALAACMETGYAPQTDPFGLAVEVWTALHGISSLRWALPGFGWPPLAEQVRGVLRTVAGVRFANGEIARPR